MQYILSKQFEKDFAKLPIKTKRKVLVALEGFSRDIHDSALRVHALRGRWIGHYSIDITGDMRAIYAIVEGEIVRFVTIGSHSQLYH